MHVIQLCTANERGRKEKSHFLLRMRERSILYFPIQENIFEAREEFLLLKKKKRKIEMTFLKIKFYF